LQNKVYPNPASDELNIVFDNFFMDNEIHKELVSSTGSIVLKTNILQKETKLDLGNMQPGVYIFKIRHASKIRANLETRLLQGGLSLSMFLRQSSVCRLRYPLAYSAARQWTNDGR